MGKRGEEGGLKMGAGCVGSGKPGATSGGRLIGGWAGIVAGGLANATRGRNGPEIRRRKVWRMKRGLPCRSGRPRRRDICARLRLELGKRRGNIFRG